MTIPKERILKLSTVAMVLCFSWWSVLATALSTNAAAACVNIAGIWGCSESVTVTCTVAGESETEHASGSGNANFIQDGCSVSYMVPQTQYTRSGFIDGNTIHLSGILAVSVPGAVINENSLTILGTISPDTASMNITGSGYASGTYEGVPASCTATTQATCTRSVTLLFLTVSSSGTGTGTIASSPAGIDCGAVCSTRYASGTSVTLTATPAGDSTFVGWSGACSGTGACTVLMNTNTTVAATFNLNQPQQDAVSLTTPGTGSGTVTSTPTGIDCGSTCSASFPIGTSLTLSAVPSSGSCFIGWGTPCSGYGTCSFTLGSDTSLTATFQPRGTTFCDVTPGGWADDYISTLFTHHVTTGCASGSDASTRRYCPSDQVTRAQMAAFIVRAKEGEPPSTLCASGSPFTDVDQNDWSCPYITRLKDLNLTTGYGGDPTLYAPSLPITREQMAAFIIRALEGEPSATLCDSGSAFVDVPASSWSCKYVKRLKDLQLTTGYGGDPTTYAPNVLVLRDQMAAFLGRAFYGMR